TKNLALRFVAGETLDEALNAARSLNARGMKVTLDALGENISSEAGAVTAASNYRAIIDRIVESGIDSSVSLKLTMLGLDIDPALCQQHMTTILDRARETGIFVRIDMEGSAYTQRTLDLFYELHRTYGDTVGIVLQSYLYRTDRDVHQAIEQGARVRLVKGAYAEPAAVAYPSKREVDAAYRREMEMLLDAGKYPAIATHDETIIEVATSYALRMGIAPDRFEFQMLYGIRRDLQDRLAREGFNVRIYVPFGSSWYPYFMRRMAERPANLLFVVRNLVRA
ncbi:MAG TPA: proline dehydrogenase family protein, partial [Nitrolancea sp.]|nr:proline dehydrogenase family protein [Nitrolancea sp.]